MVSGEDSAQEVQGALERAGDWDPLEEQEVLAAVERRMFAQAAAPLRLSRYLLLRRLGAGGAGIIYDGYDPELARRVAIKVLRPSKRSTDAAARARGRFLREAQSIARLSHPNVISVYDVGTYERWRYTLRNVAGGRPAATSPVTVADLDSDGNSEVLSGWDDGSVHVVSATDGTHRWVFNAGGQKIEAAPVVADVDGDGLAEVFVAGHNRHLYCLEHVVPQAGR